MPKDNGAEHVYLYYMLRLGDADYASKYDAALEAHSGTAIKLLTDLDGDSPVPLWAAYMHYKGIIKLAGDDPVAVVLAMNGVPMDMAGIRLQDRRRREFEANRECPRR